MPCRADCTYQASHFRLSHVANSNRAPNAGSPKAEESDPAGENTPVGENAPGDGAAPEGTLGRDDVSRQEDTLRRRNAFRREEGSRREEKEGWWPASGIIPAAFEVGLLEALSGDALSVDLSSGVSAPERSGTAAGRGAAVVYLWGIQAPRPGQPFGAAATKEITRICEGRQLRVAARSAGPEGRITRSVVAEGKGKSGRQHAWAEPSSAWGWRGRTSGGPPPSSYEAWSRRPAVRRSTGS